MTEMDFALAFDRFVALVVADGLSPHALDRARRAARFVKLRPGQNLDVDGDDDRLVFLAVGAAKLVSQSVAGREQVMAFHFPGDLVTLRTNAPNACMLNALAACDALVFEWNHLIEVARGEPAMLTALLDRAISSLYRCRDSLILLGRRSATERVAGFLLAMADQIGQPQDRGCMLQLPMSRKDIADNLGVTVETISRQVSRFRNEGLIETPDRHRVLLSDPGKLTIRAGQNRP